MKVKLSSASKEALVPQDELRFRGTGRSSILVYPFWGFTLEANRSKMRVKSGNIFHRHSILAINNE